MKGSLALLSRCVFEGFERCRNFDQGERARSPGGIKLSHEQLCGDASSCHLCNETFFIRLESCRKMNWTELCRS